MSSIAGDRGDRPLVRFASGFGRFSVVLSVLGLLLAVGLSLPSAWFDRLGGEPGGPAYTDLTPAEPVRLAVGGLSGVELVVPLVSSGIEPREALLNPPDDAPLVSWWSDSAKAGATKGQTILVGHADATGGALTALADLAKGDLVDLLTEQGTMRYQVSSVRTFDPETLERVAITLFKQDGGAGRLVLVSAEAWDGAAYERSVVVTASPLGQPRR